MRELHRDKHWLIEAREQTSSKAGADPAYDRDNAYKIFARMGDPPFQGADEGATSRSFNIRAHVQIWSLV